MKWFKRMIGRWAYEYRDAPDEISLNSVRASREVEASMCDSNPILTFRVFSAVGGSVVEFRRYDRKTDCSDTTTYIITKDQDFGEKISKIANLEMLK